MNKLIRLIGILLVVCFAAPITAQQSSTFPRVCLEDDVVKNNPQDFPTKPDVNIIQNWGKPDYDQSHWNLVPLDHLEKTGTVCWVRTHTTVHNDRGPNEHKGFIVSQVGAFEVYWDGIYIGGSGTLGYSKEEEKPSRLRAYIPLPDELLTKGHHVIGIKSSNYHRYPFIKDYNYKLEWTDPPTIFLDLSAQYIGALFSLGACLLVAIFYLSYYFITEKNPAYLLISFLSFSVSLFCVAVITHFIDMPYQFVKISSTSTVTFAGLSCWLLPIFLVQLYHPPHKWRWFLAPSIAIAIGLLLPVSWITKSVIAFASCFLISLAVILWAIKSRKPGALIVLSGFLILISVLIYNPDTFITENFAISFLILILCLLLSLNLETRFVKNALEETKLTAARLQLDLIKRNIKPHFMMNTLTSIMECLEHDKDQGIAFIHSLANEFNLINQVSDKKLIPIGEEIKLCQYHMEIMSFQQQKQYRLVVEGIDNELTIPPGILHTLVENGISHNRAKQAEIVFILSQNNENDKRIYELRTPYSPLSKRKLRSSGLGLKYVKARLQENYGGGWQFSQDAENDEWVTRITIY